MSLPFKNVFVLSMACALGASFAGCSSTDSQNSAAKGDTPQSIAGTPFEDIQPQAARPAAPAASPARSTSWPFNASNKTTNWSHLAFPTGDARSSALGIEKGVPTEVRVNQGFEYLIVASNLTGISLDSVQVTDQFGPNFKFASSTPEGKGNASSMTWDLGTLAPYESKTIKVMGMATKDGSVGSCATATYATALCSTIPVVSPKLMLTKAGPAEASKCDDILYTFEISNTGTGTITGVKVTDTLPAGMTTLDGKKSIDFTVGALAAGEKRNMSAKVRGDKVGKFENKATATADGSMTAESAVVATMLREPVLAISKKCPSQEFIRRNLDYEITVTNTGDWVSKSTVLEDVLPAGATFVSATEGGKVVDGKVVWTLGDMAPKATKTVRMSLSTVAAGSYTSTSTVRGACAAAASAACTVKVTGIPAILLEVVDVSDPSPVGSDQEYVITVTNQGTAPGTNIALTCTLEANQTYVTASGPTAGKAAGSTITFAPLASLAPKDKAVYRVIVKNVKAGDIRFKTSMISDQLTRPVEETEATNVFE